MIFKGIVKLTPAHQLDSSRWAGVNLTMPTAGVRSFAARQREQAIRLSVGAFHFVRYARTFNKIGMV